MAEHETFLHRWFEEVWNQGNEAAIDEMLADDVVGHGLIDPEGNTVRGKETFKNLHRSFLAAFSDFNVKVEDVITEGDKMAARCRITATHTGDDLGITATNQPVEFSGMLMVRVKDGQIIEAWNEFDFMKMYSQVGALSLNLQ